MGLLVSGVLSTVALLTIERGQFVEAAVIAAQRLIVGSYSVRLGRRKRAAV